MRFIYVLIAFSLTSCAPPHPPTYVRYQEVWLKDGTRCVIADYHGTGITCDWNRAHRNIFAVPEYEQD